MSNRYSSNWLNFSTHSYTSINALANEKSSPDHFTTCNYSCSYRTLWFRSKQIMWPLFRKKNRTGSQLIKLIQHQLLDQLSKLRKEYNLKCRRLGNAHEIWNTLTFKNELVIGSTILLVRSLACPFIDTSSKPIWFHDLFCFKSCDFHHLCL